jgi:hypothetical protein
MRLSSPSVRHGTISVDILAVVESGLVLSVGKGDGDCTKLHINQGVRWPKSFIALTNF